MVDEDDVVGLLRRNRPTRPDDQITMRKSGTCLRRRWQTSGADDPQRTLQVVSMKSGMDRKRNGRLKGKTAANGFSLGR